MFLQRSTVFLVLFIVTSAFGVHQISDLNPNDESYIQPSSEAKLVFDMVTSVRTLLKFQIGKEEVATGNKYLNSIKLYAYLDRPEYHTDSNPQPADNNTNVEPDFSFQLNEQRQIPSDILSKLSGRESEKWAIIIHGWQGSFENAQYYINEKGI